jgi:deoxyxylulose-5-phosphate synthase
MKVKCIEKDGCITVGKTYEVLEIDDDVGYYIIIDNDNDKMCYPKEYFKPLSEYRIEKIDKLLNL